MLWLVKVVLELSKELLFWVSSKLLHESMHVRKLNLSLKIFWIDEARLKCFCGRLFKKFMHVHKLEVFFWIEDLKWFL